MLLRLSDCRSGNSFVIAVIFSQMSSNRLVRVELLRGSSAGQLFADCFYGDISPQLICPADLKAQIWYLSFLVNGEMYSSTFGR
jgi:hypothetical protein